jgi:hypothetical protein
MEQVKEDCRESCGTLLVGSVVQDFKFAARPSGTSKGRIG